jgi:glycosyltransferase involved in cell wall biosynthesis
MSRILQINTFPTVQPRHGGQRRARQISGMLEHAGHQVCRVAAYTFSTYGWPPTEPAIDLDQFPAPPKPTISLYDGVRAMEGDPKSAAAFAALCETAAPDLLLVEEVWLWPVIRRLALVQSGQIPIIYSSYNIEAPLFRHLLVTMGHEDTEALSEEFSALEADLTRRARACIAVTEEDARMLRALGARHVVVAPNGVERRDRAHLIRALPEALNPDQNYVLYVASAHKPNASGIPDFFMAMLEALRPLERLVVVGGVCYFLSAWLHGGGPAHLARDRMVLLGEITDFCLDGLIANAAGIVLPLREGGGSNLKTAEALYSGLPLVATTVAMRGYETFCHMDGVIVADDADAFAGGMRHLLEGRLARRTTDSALDSLLWENALVPMVKLVDETISDGVATTSAARAKMPPDTERCPSSTDKLSATFTICPDSAGDKWP